MLVWAAQTMLSWALMAVAAWVVGRMLSARTLERAERAHQAVRMRIAARKAVLMRVLEVPGNLDRATYTVLVNELLFLAQLEGHWSGQRYAHGGAFVDGDGDDGNDGG